MARFVQIITGLNAGKTLKTIKKESRLPGSDALIPQWFNISRTAWKMTDIAEKLSKPTPLGFSEDVHAFLCDMRERLKANRKWMEEYVPKIKTNRKWMEEYVPKIKKRNEEIRRQERFLETFKKS